MNPPNVREPRRVLQIVNGVPWQPDTGGGILYAFDLGRRLQERGHRVDFLVATEPANEGSLEGTSVTFSFDIHKRRSPISMYRKARRRLPDYDIVHAHCKEGALIAFRRRWTRRRPRFVMTVHNPAPRRRSFFSESVRRRWERLAARCADVVCVPSEYSRRAVAEAYEMEASRLRVVPPGVPDECFEASSKPRPSLAGRPARLVSIGRICGQKGFDILLEALAKIEHDARLKIIGDGPAAEVETLENRCRELGIEDRVELTGFVPREQIIEDLAQADLFVLASRAESFGMVYAEAQAVGLPVIGTAVGGVPEVIADGVTGRLVPPEESDALAQMIDELLGDEALLQELGAAGRSRARERFSWETSVDRTEEAYEEALGKGRS